MSDDDTEKGLSKEKRERFERAIAYTKTVTD